MANTATAASTAASMRVALVVAAVLGALLGGITMLLGGEAVTTWTGVGIAILAAVLVVPVDLQQHRIPNRVTYPTTVLLTSFTVVSAVLGRDLQVILNIAVSTAAVLVIGLLMSRFGTLGRGDVKLAVVLGLGFGALGGMAVVGLFVIAVLVNGIIAVVLLATKRKTRKDYLPYAPALAVGAIAAACLQAL